MYRTADCGTERALPFSCKQRGLCPSCGARRMHDTAHHMVDRVLPDVPIRQYVLSPPSEMVGLLAARGEAVSALGRLFVESIVAGIQSRAGDKLHCGCVVFVQRFTKALSVYPSSSRPGPGWRVHRARGRHPHLCRGHGADPRGASRDRGPRRGSVRAVAEAERFPGRGGPRGRGAGRVVDRSSERAVRRPRTGGRATVLTVGGRCPSARGGRRPKGEGAAQPLRREAALRRSAARGAR